MSDHLSPVEREAPAAATYRAVKASEVEANDRVILPEFVGTVDESREEDYDAREDIPGHWYISLEGGEGAEINRDSTVFVLVEQPRAAAPSEEEIERAKLVSTEQDLSDAGDRCAELEDALLLLIAEHAAVLLDEDDDSEDRLLNLTRKGLVDDEGWTSAAFQFVRAAFLDLPKQAALAARLPDSEAAA